ncbi:MAG: hypothetical protein PARBA_01413 [Parabacteroides sp.]|jgi:membrane protein
MMDFIMVPLVVGICIAGVYGLFELFVRRKERLAIIEKIGEKLDASAFEGKLRLPKYGAFSNISFSSLKAGCLLAGIGLGLLIGFIVTTSIGMSSNMSYMGDGWQGWYRHELAGTVYGASVLLFGGIGLIVAFIVEMKLHKNEKDSETK